MLKDTVFETTRKNESTKSLEMDEFIELLIKNTKGEEGIEDEYENEILENEFLERLVASITKEAGITVWGLRFNIKSDRWTASDILKAILERIEENFSYSDYLTPEEPSDNTPMERDWDAEIKERKEREMMDNY